MARRGHRWFAAVYDLLNRSAERRLLGPIRARLLGALRGRVLEVGAGTGASFPDYAPEPVGPIVVATDPDPFMLRRAVARARQARQSGRRIRLVQCAAEALPFRDRTFDTVVAAMVL